MRIKTNCAPFRADGLTFAGIISFYLGGAINPRDSRAYLITFGAKQGLFVIGLLYGAVVVGGPGYTWIYAIFSFRTRVS
jgi:hypothetical protein